MVKFDIVARVSNFAHEPLVVNVICIFQLLNRSYLKGDVISLCQTAVSQVYLNLQPLYATDRKSAETLTVSHVHVMSAIVGILPKDQILQGNINCVYQFCLKVLENPEVRTEEQGCLGTVQLPNYMYDHSHANHWPEFSISYSLCMFHFTKWIKQETASIFSMHQLHEN